MIGSTLEKTLALWRSAPAPRGCARHERAAGPERAESGQGLSKGHIGTTPSLTFHSGAGLVRIVGGPGPLPDPEQMPKRGEISEFSAKSARRLRLSIAKIERKALGSAAFVCLTYPDQFPTDQEVYKAHNKRFAQQCARKWGLCGLWVLEFQRRGAPHFHWLLIGLEPGRLVEFRKWCAIEWARIVNSGDARHIRAGTSCDLVKYPSRATSYMAKYLSKASQKLGAEITGGKVGRYWGYLGKSRIPFGAEVREELTLDQGKRALRVARKRVAKLTWDSRWSVLKRRIVPFFRAAEFVSVAEFREWCDLARRGERIAFEFTAVMDIGEDRPRLATAQGSLAPAVFLGYVQSAGGFPRRWRARKNQSVNLFCDADNFAGKLLAWLRSDALPVDSGAVAAPLDDSETGDGPPSLSQGRAVRFYRLAPPGHEF